MDPISAVVGFVGSLITTPEEQAALDNQKNANDLKRQELALRQKELAVSANQQQQLMIAGLVGVVVIGGVWLLKD